MKLSVEHDLVFSAEQPLLKWGLHPAASDALRQVGVQHDRVGQTIGNAVASAGTHAEDGMAQGHPYCAATDFHILDLSEKEIKEFLDKISSVGFCGFYRHAGLDGWNGVTHVHAVYSGVQMKHTLRQQIHDWLAGKNGLVSHEHVTFWQPSATSQNIVRALFLHNNQMVG